MSRREREEPPFGSDSFLDVLANIVGILIILIVAAAARMGRAPAPSETSPSASNEPQIANVPVPPARAESDAPAVAARPEPESDEPPPEIAAEIQSLTRRLAALDAKTAAADVRLTKFKSESESSRKSLDDEVAMAEKQAGKLREARLRVARLEEALGERKQALSAILAEFEEAQNARPPSVEVKHHLAPISQEVTGEELHFRLSGGRVSAVPMKALEERVLWQLQRQKDWLASQGRHEGIVGPIDGYAMHFISSRKPLSNWQRQRFGYGAYRLSASCIVTPEPDLVAETAEQALRRGSRFSMAVKGAPDKAAMTFWVYPDSFHAFRMLQAACQAEGFIVSGRPLPDGVPIGSSDEGTRSAGQ